MPRPNLKDKIQKILRPIVAGQILSYYNDHISCIRDNPRVVARQLSKAIVNDLTTPESLFILGEQNDLTPLRRTIRIRRVVEGQVTSYLKSHPRLLVGIVAPKVFKKTALEWMKDSISKRIILDLTCGSTTARLNEAFLALGAEKAPLRWDGTSYCSDDSPSVVCPHCGGGIHVALWNGKT